MGGKHTPEENYGQPHYVLPDTTNCAACGVEIVKDIIEKVKQLSDEQRLEGILDAQLAVVDEKLGQ